MTKRLLVGAALATLALGACTAEPDRERQIRAPAVEVAGEPQNCIQISRIRNTVVHDDYTIDFEMLGNQVYRNTLPNRCPQLGFEERFAYEANSGSLCAIDTISVLQSGAAGRGPRCSLGQFVPVRYVEETPSGS